MTLMCMKCYLIDILLLHPNLMEAQFEINLITPLYPMMHTLVIFSKYIRSGI